MPVTTNSLLKELINGPSVLFSGLLSRFVRVVGGLERNICCSCGVCSEGYDKGTYCIVSEPRIVFLGKLCGAGEIKAPLFRSACASDGFTGALLKILCGMPRKSGTIGLRELSGCGRCSLGALGI